VDVAGQALALGQPAALPLGGRELAAGRLQLLDQPPALVALVDDPGEPEREQAAEDDRDQAAGDRRQVLRQGRPDARISRQTTSMVSATAAGMARGRRRYRKTWGYRTSSREK
jgi:hypothetical protein